MRGLSVSENILMLVTGLGVLQGILLALLVYFHPRSDRSVNRFLALFIISLSLVFTIPAAMNVIPWQRSYFTAAWPYLVTPFLYLYVRSFRKHIKLKEILLNQISFVVVLIYSFWYLDQLSKAFPGSTEIPKNLMKHPLVTATNTVKLLQHLIYLFLAARELRRYQRSIKHVFSETSRISMNWVRVLIYGMLVIMLATIVFYILMVKYPENINLFILLNIAIGTPYIYIISFKGIMQPTVWQAKTEAVKKQVEENMKEAEVIEEQQSQPEKPRPRPGLTEEKVNEMINQIVEAMERDKLYQETELTLQDLADKLNAPSHQVSYALNEGMKKNFYDVINSYRVEEAKRLLLDPRTSNYTILSVGFEAGFNSKTTFNTVFKKFTGQTPTVFRDLRKSAMVSA